jgi:hypothetical protein
MEGRAVIATTELAGAAGIATGRPALVVQSENGFSVALASSRSFRARSSWQRSQLPAILSGTETCIPRSTAMTRITTVVTEWIGRRLLAKHAPWQASSASNGRTAMKFGPR